MYQTRFRGLLTASGGSSGGRGSLLWVIVGVAHVPHLGTLTSARAVHAPPSRPHLGTLTVARAPKLTCSPRCSAALPGPGTLRSLPGRTALWTWEDGPRPGTFTERRPRSAKLPSIACAVPDTLASGSRRVQKIAGGPCAHKSSAPLKYSAQPVGAPSRTFFASRDLDLGALLPGWDLAPTRDLGPGSARSQAGSSRSQVLGGRAPGWEGARSQVGGRAPGSWERGVPGPGSAAPTRERDPGGRPIIRERSSHLGPRGAVLPGPKGRPPRQGAQGPRTWERSRTSG